MKFSNEIKIAIFVISSLLLLVFGWAFLREVTLHEQTTFQVVYSDVSGLARGSFIHVNGLRVGRVDSLTLNTKEKNVIVDARIQVRDVRIPKDSKMIIRTSGYVGDKFLDIVLGDSNKYIMSGDLVQGEAVFDSFKSLDRISEVVDQLEPKVLGKSIQSFVEKADSLVGNTDEVVKQLPKGDDLTRLVSTASTTVNNLNVSITMAEQLIQTAQKTLNDDKAVDNFNNVLTNAKEVSMDLTVAINEANSLVNNEKAFEDINNVLIRASKVAEQVDEIRADPLIQNNISMTLENANVAAQKVSVASDDLSSALHQRFIFPKLFFWKLLPGKSKSNDVN